MERRTPAYLDALPVAVRTLADVRPAVIVLAHTGVSPDRPPRRAGGHSGNNRGRRDQCRTRQLGVKRLALATPYPDSISEAGRAFWAASGFEIVGYHRLLDVANIYEDTKDERTRSAAPPMWRRRRRACQWPGSSSASHG